MKNTQKHAKNERGDDEQQKKQVRRAGVDPGRIGGDRREFCLGGAGNREKSRSVPVWPKVWPIQKNEVVTGKTGSGKRKYHSVGRRRTAGVYPKRQEVLHEVVGRRRQKTVGISQRDRGGRVWSARIIHRKPEFGSKRF